MKSIIARSLIAVLLVAVSKPSTAAEAISLTRQDNKTVKANVYTPSITPCLGVAIISHGAGGTEDGYRYLGDELSSLGYLTLVVDHQESDRSALRKYISGNGLKKGLENIITDPDAYRGRFMDIAAAKQWAQTKCQSSESILAGHSMGAATVMMEAGAKNNLGIVGGDSFNLYIALSPQGVGSIFPENAWAKLNKPVLSVTGTRDTELGGASWETRTEPFNNMPVGCKWLAVIDGATHLNFAGVGMSRKVTELTSNTIASFIEGVHRGKCQDAGQMRGVNLLVK